MQNSQMSPLEGKSSVKGMERWELFTELKSLDKEKRYWVRGRERGKGIGVGALFLRSSLCLTQGHFSIQVAK